MNDYSIQEIRKRLIAHKQNCAKAYRIRAIIRRDGSSANISLIDKFDKLHDRINEVESWLLLLSEDELYVIRRHLFDGYTWTRIEAEYAERWKDFSKTSRTLMRYQERALHKIQDYLSTETYLYKQKRRI